MNKMQAQVKTFMREVAGQPTPEQLASPAEVPWGLRAQLVLEEATEFALACVGPEDFEVLLLEVLGKTRAKYYRAETQDYVETLDGICDLLYVVFGAAVALGVNIEPFFDEVHRSNMAKAGGHHGAHGRWEKPDGWTPPDVPGLLRRLREGAP